MAEFYTYLGDLRPWGNGTPIAYKIVNTLELESGTFAAWDATNGTLVKFIRDGSGGKFAGVLAGSSTMIKSLGNQAALIPPKINVFTSGIHQMLGTAAETYTHGVLVYMNGTTANKITTVQGTGGVVVGSVHLPDGSTLTGAVRVPILIDEYTITQI